MRNAGQVKKHQEDPNSADHTQCTWAEPMPVDSQAVYPQRTHFIL